MADLRPLVLLEALRKAWFSIFVSKIQNYWKREGLLNEAQHGSIRGKGTETAILEMIEALEVAKERRATVVISSWDMR